MMETSEAGSLEALTRAFVALGDVATAATTTPDPVPLARIVVDRVRDLLDVDAAGLSWWDETADALRILATNDLRTADPEPAVPVGQGAVGLAYARRKPVVVDDYAAWEHALPWARERGMASCLAVPLLVGSRPVGVVTLTSYRPRHFAGAEVQLLCLVAAQIGPTLEAARLYDEAERHRRDLMAQAARLATSEETLRTLFGAMSCGILVRDSTGRIVDANAWAQRFFGLTLEQMRGRRSEELWQAFREDGTELGPGERPGMVALRTGQPIPNFVMEVTRPGGSRRWIQVESAPIVGPDGRPTQVVSSFVDVTERKEAERDLRTLAQTEKLRALGQMASGVAHDLNQYLGLVVGHGDLALRALDRPDADVASARESLRIVVQAALDGAETVKRLLTFGRPHLDVPTERLRVEDLLREVASLSSPRWRDASQAEGRPIKLQVEADEDAWIEGSPEALREALTNLVFNAVDALPRGGTIRLIARRRKSRVEIDVSDTGIGMSEDVRARIFEPFFTTKGDRGTGLGLAVVFGVVQRHHGEITVESAPDHGTTFRLTFPAAVGSPKTAEAPAGVSQSRPLQILIVDDDPSLGRLMQLMLAPGGHTVVVAASGEAALDLLARRSFDLVISDLGLGAGMNGWELGEIVRSRYPELPLCLATGWGAQIDADQALKAGIHAVLAKPYRLADLNRLVASLR